MKEIKERFISIDDSGESIFTFDEADMIIDTKTNIVYGANNIPDLVKILNSQSLQWQKLKEWLEEMIKEYEPTYDEWMALNYDFYNKTHKQSLYKKILDKIKELEVEDEIKHR